MLGMAVACHSLRSTPGQGSPAAPLPYVSPSSVPPLSVTSSTPTQPGSSTAKPSQENSAPTLQPVPSPANASSRAISLYLRTKQKGIIPAAPAQAPASARAVDVPSYTWVTPPEPSGCPWKNSRQVHAGRNVPAGCDWSATTVWIKASAYPASPSAGTTWIYGHFCLRHICPFSAIKRQPGGRYTVQPGDQLVIGVQNGTLTYEDCGIGISDKYQSNGQPAKRLSVPRCDKHIDVILVTCDEDGLHNIVMAWHLIAAVKR